MTRRSGAELLCASLEALGVDCVFGLPGTQTVPLFEALRRSRIRAVLPTHELAAAFMANGYARVAGRVGVVVTIPGPGFTYALTGLAEARLDSVPLVHITLAPARAPGTRFQLQAIDQTGIAGPLVKDVFEVSSADQVPGAMAQALAASLAGDPGPVLVQLESAALGEATDASPDASVGPPGPPGSPAAADLEGVAVLLRGARRPLLFVGQGAAGVSPQLVAVAERYRVPVVTTASGRGIVPEDHPLALSFDGHRGDVETLNIMLAESDLVVVVGCKLSHSDTVGFTVRLPPDRLVHVDADAGIPGANYPCRTSVHASAQQLVTHLLSAAASGGASEWTPPAIAVRRERLRALITPELPEPSIAAASPGAFFAALRQALPRDGILVTDSGLHQGLARRYFDVLCPSGLITPTDFQSMGFGLPAALGAKLAGPGRAVVALVGDGGFLMSGFELVTAVRERIPVTVIVFNDGQLNLIRLQQLREYGHAHAVEVRTPDLETLAEAVGVEYLCLEAGGDAEAILRAAIPARAPVLVEVRVGDSRGIRAARARSLARETVRRALGPRLVGWLKDKLR